MPFALRRELPQATYLRLGVGRSLFLYTSNDGLRGDSLWGLRILSDSSGKLLLEVSLSSHSSAMAPRA